jgi:hypothetical protein
MLFSKINIQIFPPLLLFVGGASGVYFIIFDRHMVARLADCSFSIGNSRQTW